MNKNKSIAGFDIDVLNGQEFEYVESGVPVLGTKETGTADHLGIDFLAPCLGILGYSEEDDILHGSHIVAPTEFKVEDFLNRYEPDAVVVTGLNYGEEQLENHREREWAQELDLAEGAQTEPQEAYEVAADGGLAITDLTPVEDMLYKRGGIEKALDRNETEYVAQWARGPCRYSIMEASIPEEEIKIAHLK